MGKFFKYLLPSYALELPKSLELPKLMIENLRTDEIAASADIGEPFCRRFAQMSADRNKTYHGNTGSRRKL